jgi:hypothetical protein
MSTHARVRVPQKDGAVVVTFDGDPDDVHTFTVTSGHVSARDDRDVRALLAVEGAELVQGDLDDDASPAPATAEQPTPSRGTRARS